MSDETKVLTANDMFAESDAQVARATQTLGLERPPESRSFVHTVTAPLPAIGHGVVMGFAGLTDLAKTSRQGLAFEAYADPAAYLSAPDAEHVTQAIIQNLESAQSDDAFSSYYGDRAREFAKLIEPPETASWAESTTFNLASMLTQAIGATAAGGPVAGAAVFGAVTGVNESDRLKQQGVDRDTRSKVGWVAGGSAAVQTLVPAAGATGKATIGLIAAGGPVAYVAESKINQAILENAKYSEVATQYGTTAEGYILSTVMAGVFGGVAHVTRPAKGMPRANPHEANALRKMPLEQRKNLSYNHPFLDSYLIERSIQEGVPPEILLAIKNAGERSPSSKAVSKKSAKGMMQFIKDTWQKFGRGDITDPIESMDAAVRYIKHSLKVYKGNVDAVIADYNGGPPQANPVMRGETPPAGETQRYLKRTRKYLNEIGSTISDETVAIRNAINADPGLLDAARVNLVNRRIAQASPLDMGTVAGVNTHTRALEIAREQLSMGEPVRVDHLIDPDLISRARRIDQESTQLQLARDILLEDLPELNEGFSQSEAKNRIIDAEKRINSIRNTGLDDRINELIAADKNLGKRAAKRRAEIEQEAAIQNIRDEIESIRGELQGDKEARAIHNTLADLNRVIGDLDNEKAAIGTVPSKLSDAVKGTLTKKSSTPPPNLLSQSPELNNMADWGEFNFSRRALLDAYRRGDMAASIESLPANNDPASSDAIGGTDKLASIPDQKIDEIATKAIDEIPALEIDVDGEKMLASDFLELVRREAEQMKNDAPLARVAAECFLMNGG